MMWERGKVFDARSLLELNPTKMELLKDSSLFNVFQKTIEMYYKGFGQVTLNDVMLADSAESALEIDDICEWKLGNYYMKNQLTLSIQ